MLKKSRNYVALVLALVMSISTFIPAFAMELIEPATLEITKLFKMPEGTTTPVVEFEFEAKAIDSDGDKSQGALNSMPELQNLSVSYTSDDKGVNESNLKLIKKESDNILDGVTFDAAGYYVYEITEKESDDFESEKNANEELWYSEAKYELTVEVGNGGPGGTYIKAVYVKVVEKDENSPDVDKKVDLGDKDGLGMVFTNAYVKTTDELEPLEDGTLAISNSVTGDLPNLGHYFQYQITMTSTPAHDNHVIPSYYKAYIVEDDEVIEPVAGDNVGKDLIQTPQGVGDKYINIASSGPTSFGLKHGQKLVLVNTPIGTKFEIAQEGLINHVPSYNVTINSVSVSSGAAAEGENLSVPTQTVLDPVNLVAFSNVRGTASMTGLSLDNLPFVLMIIFGLGCLGAYIVVGARKRAPRREQ